MSILFKGDNKALISSINALLALDAKGALSPHGIGEMARDLLETCAARLPTEQHQREPVAWLARAIDSDGTTYRQCVSTNQLTERDAWFAWGEGVLNRCRLVISPLYTHADPGEVERLTRKAANTDLALAAQTMQVHNLRSQVAEAQALLRAQDDLLSEAYRLDIGTPLKRKMRAQHATLYASAEPSVPKCETCKGNGVIGWRRGQTAESYEEGESPCEDCNATGYAHSNGMPVSGACTTCNGLGTVPDGEISGLDGAEFENGPIECIKDCPDCKPRAPTVTDEPTDLATWKRRAIEAESKLRTYDPQILDLSQREMAALLADPRPAELVLMKCVLCDQLQADLTERDEKLDQTQDLLRYMVHDYRAVVQAGYDRITALGSDCDSVAKMLKDNPNYQKALALLLPDLESRPEERGTPETEPCSGCGTPGWTGTCNKCVPY